jgi:hypothetical protein
MFVDPCIIVLFMMKNPTRCKSASKFCGVHNCTLIFEEGECAIVYWSLKRGSAQSYTYLWRGGVHNCTLIFEERECTILHWLWSGGVHNCTLTFEVVECTIVHWPLKRWNAQLYTDLWSGGVHNCTLTSEVVECTIVHWPLKKWIAQLYTDLWRSGLHNCTSSKISLDMALQLGRSM